MRLLSLVLLATLGAAPAFCIRDLQAIGGNHHHIHHNIVAGPANIPPVVTNLQAMEPGNAVQTKEGTNKGTKMSEEEEEGSEEEPKSLGKKLLHGFVRYLSFSSSFLPDHAAVGRVGGNVEYGGGSGHNHSSAMRPQNVHFLENLRCHQQPHGNYFCQGELPPALEMDKHFALYSSLPPAKNNVSHDPTKMGQVATFDPSKCEKRRKAVQKIKGKKTVKGGKEEEDEMEEEAEGSCRVHVKVTKEKWLAAYEEANQIRPYWHEHLFVKPFSGNDGRKLWDEKEEAKVAKHLGKRVLLQAPGTGPTFTIVNKCEWPVMAGILTGDGRYAQPANGGLPLLSSSDPPQQFAVPFDMESLRIWGRFGCKADGTGCSSGRCGGSGVQCAGTGGEPPVGLAEMTFNPKTGVFYDTSLVDGFNMPFTITPQGGQGDRCKVIAGCDLRGLTGLPDSMQIKNENQVTYLIRSQCEAAKFEIGTNTNPSADQKLKVNKACCSATYPDVAKFDTPDTCHPVYQNEAPFSTIYNQMNAQCPQAYLYAYDDEKATFVCISTDPTQITKVNFEIRFC